MSTSYVVPEVNEPQPVAAGEVLPIASGDLPQSANEVCWPAQAEMEKTTRGRAMRVELENTSAALAFQVSVAVRTQSGGLIAPVIWSDNWIELVPGEKRVLTALLPGDEADAPAVKIESWNAGSQTITPMAAVTAQ